MKAKDSCVVTVRVAHLRKHLLLGTLLLYTVALAVASLMPVSRASSFGATPVRRAINNLLHVPAYALLAWLWTVQLSRRSLGLGSQRALLWGGGIRGGHRIGPAVLHPRQKWDRRGSLAQRVRCRPRASYGASVRWLSGEDDASGRVGQCL